MASPNPMGSPHGSFGFMLKRQPARPRIHGLAPWIIRLHAKQSARSVPESHGLAPWIIRLHAKQSARSVPESHGLAPWIIRLHAKETARGVPESHGLAPWIIRLHAKETARGVPESHGLAPWIVRLHAKESSLHSAPQPNIPNHNPHPIIHAQPPITRFGNRISQLPKLSALTALSAAAIKLFNPALAISGRS